MVNLKKLLTKILLKICTKTLGSGDDLNTLIGSANSGLYYVTTGVANSPNTWHTLLVIGGLGTSQIMFGPNAIYVRMYTGSPLAWTSWRQLDVSYANSAGEWWSLGTNSSILALGSPPSTSTYGTIIRLRGNGVPGTSGTSDTYWLGIDSSGRLFTGTQLNGATTITWQEK